MFSRRNVIIGVVVAVVAIGLIAAVTPSEQDPTAPPAATSAPVERETATPSPAPTMTATPTVAPSVTPTPEPTTATQATEPPAGTVEPTATMSADQLFRAYFAVYPLDGVAYHEIQGVALSVCFDFDDGVTAEAIIRSALEHFADRSESWITRLFMLIGAGVEAFCPDHSSKFEEVGR